MRILALTPGLYFSGAPLMLYNLLASLAGECEIKVMSLVSERGPLSEHFEAAGIEVVGPEISGERFDVCLCNTILASHAVVQLGRSFPTVWWIHEPTFGLNYVYSKVVDLAAFGVATRVVFPTRWQAEFLYGPWLRRDSWEVVHSSIPPRDGVTPAPLGADGRFILVHIGSLDHRKGQDLTIRALELLDDDDIRVYFIGENARGTTYAIDERHRHRFVFTGGLSPDEVVAHLHGADAFVFPTREDLIPLVVLEAMHYGKPVLTSDFGPIPETVVHGRTGLLSPVDDPHVLAGNIAMIKRDPALRERLVRDAATLYRRKHAFADHRAAMLRVLRDAAAHGPA